MIKPRRVRQVCCELWENEELLLKLIKMNLREPYIVWGEGMTGCEGSGTDPKTGSCKHSYKPLGFITAGNI
jgi:hypothetical protein